MSLPGLATFTIICVYHKDLGFQNGHLRLIVRRALYCGIYGALLLEAMSSFPRMRLLLDPSIPLRGGGRGQLAQGYLSSALNTYRVLSENPALPSPLACRLGCPRPPVLFCLFLRDFGKGLRHPWGNSFSGGGGGGAVTSRCVCVCVCRQGSRGGW